MPELTRTHLRGLVIPDPRITYEGAYSSTLSTVTQAGPMAGQAEAAGDTYAALVAVGDQPAGSSLEVYAARGGMPGVDLASVVWRRTGGTSYRGWEPPQTITGFDFAAFTTTAGDYQDPCILRLSDDSLLIVFERTSTGQILGRRRSASAATWTSETIYTHPTGVYASGARPCLVELPSGRVLLFHCVEDAATSTVQIGMRYSDDQGDTWSLGQRVCLRSAISTTTTTVQRLRAAYLAGQIVLFADLRDTSTTYYRRLTQFASADLGSTFSQVDKWSGVDADNQGAYPDVAATSDAIVLTYVRYDGTRSRPRARRLGSAFARFSAQTEVKIQDDTNPMSWGSYSAGDYTAGDMAVCADDVGRIYAFGRDLSVAGLDDVAVRYTDDGGSSWSGMGSSSHQTTKAMLWRGEDSSTSPAQLSATWQRGRAAIAHIHTSTGTTADASIAVLFAGGWSSVQMPALTSTISHDTMTAWEITYLPYDMPEATGTAWTLATVGPPTIALGATGLSINTGAVGQSAGWSATPTTSLLEGLIAEVWVDVAVGVAQLDVRVGVAGPTSYAARVEATPTTIRLLDLTSAAVIATINTSDAQSGIFIRMAVGNGSGAPANNGEVYAWYCVATRGDGEDRNWIPIGNTATLQQGASATSLVRFGAVSGALGINVQYRWAAYTFDSYAGTDVTQIYGGQGNPSDLLGHDLPAQPMYIADGVSVYGVDGPAFVGDSWTVATAYQYPIRAIHAEEEPSPRRAWRSVDDDSEQIIAWSINAAGANTSPSMGVARVLYLGGINFRTAYLEGLQGGVWVPIVTVDAAETQTGLGYQMNDGIVKPDPGAPPRTAIGRYLTHGELVGSYFARNGGANVYKILDSTPGAWPGSSLAIYTTAATRLRVNASGGALSGTDGEVRSDRVCVVINDTTNANFAAYRLRIPVQVTAEGYFQVGVAILGHLHAFGQQYGSNRAQEITPAYSLTEGRGGARRAQRTGPARRAVEVSWDDGVDGSGLATVNPDYVRAHSSADPIASPVDVAPSMLGVIADLDGAVTPVVYLPSVLKLSGATTTYTIVAPPLMLYGRVMSETLRVDTVQGDEYQNPGEVYRLARVRIEEEL